MVRFNSSLSNDYVNSMNGDHLYHAQCQHILIIVYSDIC
jgi:hypothetical protein